MVANSISGNVRVNRALQAIIMSFRESIYLLGFENSCTTITMKASTDSGIRRKGPPIVGDCSSASLYSNSTGIS